MHYCDWLFSGKECCAPARSRSWGETSTQRAAAKETNRPWEAHSFGSRCWHYAIAYNNTFISRLSRNFVEYYFKIPDLVTY